jgi:hypothetical protein
LHKVGDAYEDDDDTRKVLAVAFCFKRSNHYEITLQFTGNGARKCLDDVGTLKWRVLWSAKNFPHNDDSRIYIELSEN